MVRQAIARAMEGERLRVRLGRAGRSGKREQDRDCKGCYAGQDGHVLAWFVSPMGPITWEIAIMIAAIAGLLTCQLIGEILVRALLLPLPGPVAGLALMFLFLVWHGRGHPEMAEAIPLELGRVSDTLLRNLSLLFIPAAVGVVQYLDLLRANAAAITIAIVVSTTLSLVVTAVHLPAGFTPLRVPSQGTRA